MPVLLWFFIGLMVVGTAFVSARSYFRRDDDPDKARAATIAAGVSYGIAVFLLILSSLTVVPANQVGIVTKFGAWSGTLDSGLHFVAPWSTVDTFPTRNQKSVRDQAEGNDACIPVKLNGGAGACVDATILYTIDEKNAEILWRGWGSFAKLNGDLINRATDDAAGVVYGGYDPKSAASGTNRQKITDAIADRLRSTLDHSGVHLESVTLGDIHLPDDVQSRINAVLEQDARTEIAKKKEEQATAEARANAALQQSLTPEALIKLCLDAAREIKPQVFNCMGGEQPPVILSRPNN